MMSHVVCFDVVARLVPRSIFAQVLKEEKRWYANTARILTAFVVNCHTGCGMRNNSTIVPKTFTVEKWQTVRD